MGDGTAAGWAGELRRAFGLLLGRPLDAFDPAATFALYYWDEMLDAEFYRDLDVAAMHTAERRQPSDVATPFRSLGDADGSPPSWARYGFDLGRSMFEIDDDIPLPVDVRTALGGLLDGVDLADVLTRYDVDLARLADPRDDYATCGVRLLARVQTDGSLFDALRAATRTMDGPHRLTPFVLSDDEEDDGAVEPQWEEALRHVRHDALRDHLRSQCLTTYRAAGEGAHYLGNRCPAPLAPVAARGHPVIAGWSFGLDQAAAAIVRLGP